MLSTVPAAQGWLAELLAERVGWVTGAPAGEPGKSAPDQVAPDQSAPDTVVLVLLRSWRLADLVYGARQFAAALDPAEAAAWRRSWTRTRFLFGNPANLGPANRARVVAPGATAGWLGPFPDRHRPGLSRLLKPVTGTLPELPRDLDLPGIDLAHADAPTADAPTADRSSADLPSDGPRRVLRVAVAGLTLVEYLVHLHHTVAEAVLLGRLRPDEPLRLSHRPALAADPRCGPPGYARVLPDPADSGRLRLHTWLSG